MSNITAGANAGCRNGSAPLKAAFSAGLFAGANGTRLDLALSGYFAIPGSGQETSLRSTGKNGEK
ncbi:MAG: hypothetical protein CVU16_02925 [Betaproteobacteria bacterium HGW-Betaproteobacteria-10]|jgi:hypothetical protein|nr:MAG: hypothetical protein CVU16_02925 [Betaproteobacteria bacterium HGW-Betaproteobacteria-10]